MNTICRIAIILIILISAEISVLAQSIQQQAREDALKTHRENIGNKSKQYNYDVQHSKAPSTPVYNKPNNNKPGATTPANNLFKVPATSNTPVVTGKTYADLAQEDYVYLSKTTPISIVAVGTQVHFYDPISKLTIYGKYIGQTGKFSIAPGLDVVIAHPYEVDKIKYRDGDYVYFVSNNNSNNVGKLFKSYPAGTFNFAYYAPIFDIIIKDMPKDVNEKTYAPIVIKPKDYRISNVPTGDNVYFNDPVNKTTIYGKYIGQTKRYNTSLWLDAVIARPYEIDKIKYQDKEYVYFVSYNNAENTGELYKTYPTGTFKFDSNLPMLGIIGKDLMKEYEQKMYTPVSNKHLDAAAKEYLTAKLNRTGVYTEALYCDASSRQQSGILIGFTRDSLFILKDEITVSKKRICTIILVAPANKAKASCLGKKYAVFTNEVNLTGSGSKTLIPMSMTTAALIMAAEKKINQNCHLTDVGQSGLIGQVVNRVPSPVSY